jgi:hypothetical protein
MIDLIEEKENALDSIRVNSESFSNEIDDRELQYPKHNGGRT